MPDLRAIVVIEENDITTVVNPSAIVEGNIVAGPDSSVDGHMAVFDGTSGALLRDGGAPGGGGSFLSANVVRVDPSGSDETGTVGDLSKPFLTVQGAVDAIVALALPATAFAIDIGVNQFGESLTIEDEVVLVFVGANCDTSSPCAFLTITAQATIYAVNCAFGLGGISTSALFTMFLQESRAGSITSTASGGTLTIGSYYNTGAIGEVIADDVSELYIFGVVPTDDTSISSANATEVTLRTVRQNLLGDQYGSIFSVTATAAVVSATDSLLSDVECDSLSNWIDSRVTGSITLGEGNFVEAHDVVLNPALMDFSTLPDSDPEVLGLAWMDSGVFTISQGPPP